MPRRLTQPPNSAIYIVKSSDTVSSIALRYDTTPTELSRLNHLSSSMLFPGQTLFVPNESSSSSGAESNDAELETLHTIGQHSSDSIRILQSPKRQPFSPVREMFSPDRSLEQLLDGETLYMTGDEISTRYLKIKAKYVTDGQGVVSGILLVTPQTVMFNPCVSDHLVVDRGRETYLVRLSLKAISRVSFFEDIAAMVVGDVSQEYSPSCRFIDYNSESLPKPGMIICQETGEEYMLPSPTSDSNDDAVLDKNLINSSRSPCIVHNADQIKCEDDKKHYKTSIDQGISTLPDSLMDTTETDDTITSPTCLDIAEEPKNSENKRDLCIFMDNSHSSSTPKHSANINVDQTKSDESNAHRTCFDTDQIKTNSQTNIDESVPTENFVENITNNETIETANDKTIENCNMPITSPLHSPLAHKTELISPNDDISKDSGISEINTTNFSHQDSHESDQLMHQPLAHRSSLSNEAKQWLGKRGIKMASIDDSSLQGPKEHIFEEVLPRPASKYEDHLMYVSIKVHKNYWYSNRTKQNNVMGIPPNRDQKRRQHWFAIPSERVEQFYSFLLHWAPDVNAITSTPSTPCSEGFLDDDEGLNIVDNTFGYSPATTLGYEKLTEDDAASMLKARVGSLNSVSSRASLRSLEDESPELLNESTLLTKLQIRLLARCLPKRTVGHSWELVYSTNLHGISLSTLYRNFQDCEDPSVIIVKDENQKLFGAFLSDAPKISEGFYGTGESMLFTFTADNKLTPYPWSGDNNFFIKGSKTSLIIGGGEGIFGLWLDEDLYHGRSHSCKTFGNETLSQNEDFICSSLEAWAFV